MPLTARQRSFYTYTADLYKPVFDVVNKNARDLQYVKVYSNVPIYYSSTPEVDEMKLPGRSKIVNMFTLDQFHLLPEYEIEETWMLHLKSPVNHPDCGGWWIIEGNAQTKFRTRIRKPNYRLVYGKRGTEPHIIED